MQRRRRNGNGSAHFGEGGAEQVLKAAEQSGHVPLAVPVRAGPIRRARARVQTLRALFLVPAGIEPMLVHRIQVAQQGRRLALARSGRWTKSLLPMCA